MKLAFSFAVLLFAISSLAMGQDVVKVAPGHNKILLENDQVRVVENTLKPGEIDPPHTHPHGWYYVTEPGSMKITMADGKVILWEPKSGESGWLKTMALHSSENVGKTAMKYVLVEVKSAETAK